MFDLSINSNFQDYSDLSDYEGIAINHQIETSDSPTKTIFPINISQYFKIDLKLDISTLNYNYKKINCDIFCITPVDEKSLETAISWNPDIIYINKIFKHSLIREIVNKNIFIEIRIRDGLYNRVEWLKIVNNIFRATKKNIIITSDANNSMELKKSSDIIKMLKIFGISNEIGNNIVYEYPKRLLTRCAFKRYSFNGVISDTDEGILKKDFLDHKFN